MIPKEFCEEGDEGKLAIQNSSNLKHTIERHSELTGKYTIF